jgi:hypothetical protein
MGWNDYSKGSKNFLIALFCWQCLDILLHIAVNKVTVAHALANAVWWVGVPVIFLAVEPAEAYTVIVGLDLLYWGMIAWNLADNTIMVVFVVLVLVTQGFAFGAAYLSSKQERPPVLR